MIWRLRWRLARFLVGPFVQIPERKGAWIVIRLDGGFAMVYEADKLRLKMGTELTSLDDRSPYRLPAHVRPRTTGRFVGTVKIW